MTSDELPLAFVPQVRSVEMMRRFNQHSRLSEKSRRAVRDGRLGRRLFGRRLRRYAERGIRLRFAGLPGVVSEPPESV